MVKGNVKQQFEGTIDDVIIKDGLIYAIALEILEKVESKYDVNVSDYCIKSLIKGLNVWLYQDEYSKSSIMSGIDTILYDNETFTETMFEGVHAEHILYDAHRDYVICE